MSDHITANDRRTAMHQRWADQAREEIAEQRSLLAHYRALRDRIEAADREDLEALLGPVMSEARRWSPDSIDCVEVRVSFGDVPGEVDRMTFSALQGGAYTDVSGDWTWTIGPDRFLSYRELRRAALDALGQAIGGAELAIDQAAERAQRYGQEEAC